MGSMQIRRGFDFITDVVFRVYSQEGKLLWAVGTISGLKGVGLQEYSNYNDELYCFIPPAVLSGCGLGSGRENA